MKSTSAGVKRPGRGPEAGAVEGRDVAPPQIRRRELGRERVRVPPLAHVVVGRLADADAHVRIEPGGDERVAERRQRTIEHALPRDEPGKAEAQVLHDRTAQVATGGDARRVAEDVVDERVAVAGVRGEVVEAVGSEPRVAEAAEVRHDHLEPAAASGSMLRHQMRFVSGQPCTSSSGTPPMPARTYASVTPGRTSATASTAPLGALTRRRAFGRS